jgi:hypothetical protein
VVFLFFLTRFLELKPIPLDSFPAIPLPASGALGISNGTRGDRAARRGRIQEEHRRKTLHLELTVKTHIRNIYAKLDVKNRVELALLFAKTDKISRMAYCAAPGAGTFLMTNCICRRKRPRKKRGGMNESNRAGMLLVILLAGCQPWTPVCTIRGSPTPEPAWTTARPSPSGCRFR